MLRRLALLAALAAAPCVAQDAPPVELGLTAIVDSARLHASLAGVRAEAGPDAARTFYVSFDSSGVPNQVLAGAVGVMSARYLARVGPLVRESVRSLPAGERGRFVYLLAESGTSPRIAIAHPRLVQPRLANRSLLARLLTESTRTMMGMDTALTGRPLNVLLRMLIRADGTADSVRIERSSGSPQVDRAAARISGQARFIPGTFDGLPSRVWIFLPLTFVLPDEEPEAPVKRGRPRE